MTNEEAIELLKNGTMFMPTLQNSEYPEAFDLAIKALQKEEPQSDLISREALRNVILNDRKLDGANANWEVNRILVHIDNAPTVDIKDQIAGAYNEGYACGSRENERPQGEWKVYGTQGGIPITDYCSNCKYEMKWYKNKYNFCPNCGADMRKGTTNV